MMLFQVEEVLKKQLLLFGRDVFSVFDSGFKLFVDGCVVHVYTSFFLCACLQCVAYCF